jgi:hypothetical protein
MDSVRIFYRYPDYLYRQLIFRLRPADCGAQRPPRRPTRWKYFNTYSVSHDLDRRRSGCLFSPNIQISQDSSEKMKRERRIRGKMILFSAFSAP